MKKIIATFLGISILCFSISCRKKDKSDECPVCPVIDGFTPGHGKYLDTIYISGKNFKTNPDGLSLNFDFNGMPAKYVSVKNDGEAMAVIPKKCGTGPIRAYYDNELYGESSTAFVYDFVNVVSTFAGKCSSGTLENTDPLLANIYSPDNIFLDEPRGYVYVISNGTDLCRIGSGGLKKIITTSDYVQAGACDSYGNIYLAFSDYIAKVETGVVTSLKAVAGLSGTPGHVDAVGTAARFSGIASMIIDEDNFYIGENSYIRKMDVKTSTVSSISGTSTVGFFDGPAASAKFNYIASLAIDKNKNLYIADWNNSRIRKLANGAVSTIAGDGTESIKNGIGTSAQLQKPRSLAVDYEGNNIYFSDSFITTFMRKMNVATGEVSYFSGDLSLTGSTDGSVDIATYNNPVYLIYAKNANAIYIADNFNCKIRKVSFE
ncbi:MAG TPA: IPT/TIG domain-containing protein [Bacteroidia bacterium]|jgi:hypothetical protein|nr:IPT/TIG domain-containing protein [Bacteroidia bacterium]